MLSELKTNCSLVVCVTPWLAVTRLRLNLMFDVGRTFLFHVRELVSTLVTHTLLITRHLEIFSSRCSSALNLNRCLSFAWGFMIKLKSMKGFTNKYSQRRFVLRSFGWTCGMRSSVWHTNGNFENIVCSWWSSVLNLNRCLSDALKLMIKLKSN